MSHLSYLFSIVALSLGLAPENRKLPPEFQRLPKQVREQATIIVSGTFGHAGVPGFLTPDGSEETLLESWFKITRVYRGEVGGEYIYLNVAMLPKTPHVRQKLARGRRYLVLLRPDSESTAAIKTGKHVPVWEAVNDKEILAIVKLN